MYGKMLAVYNVKVGQTDGFWMSIRGESITENCLIGHHIMHQFFSVLDFTITKVKLVVVKTDDFFFQLSTAIRPSHSSL